MISDPQAVDCSTPRANSTRPSSTRGNKSAHPNDGSATPRGVADPPLREWQEDLLEIFEKAVLPASQHLFDLVRTHQDSKNRAGGEERLNTALKEYYASVNRGKLNDREMVWGKTEKKIETFLLSPPSDINGGKRFLRAQYQAATGAGKTRSFMEIIRVHMASNVRVDEQSAPLYVVVEPEITLVEQTYNVIKEVDGLDCVCVGGSSIGPVVEIKDISEHVRDQRKNGRPTAIIATIHSAAGAINREGMLATFTSKGIVADLMILDESHKYAGEATGIQRTAFVDNAGAAMLKISCTATPTVRSVPDDQSNGFPVDDTKTKVGNGMFFCQNDVNGVFGPVMCRYTYGEGLEDGVVAPLQLHLMDNSIPGTGGYQEYLTSLLKKWDAEQKGVTVVGGGLGDSVGGETTEPEKVGKFIADPLDATSAQKRVSELPHWRRERLLMVCRIVYEFAVGNQTHLLAFCSSVQLRPIYLTDLVKFVCTEMIASIDGGSSPLGYKFGEEERRRLVTLRENCFYEVSNSKGNVEPFKNAKVGFLANLRMLQKGVDIPHLTGIWYPDAMSITDSHGLIQSAGRGTRTTKGKAGCVVFLPCFLPDAPLAFTLRDATKMKETVGKLDEKAQAAKSTWEGMFSRMAKELVAFFVQNQNEVHDLRIQLSSCRSDDPLAWAATRDPSTPERTARVSPKADSNDPATSVIAPGTTRPGQRRAAASPSRTSFDSISSPAHETTAVRNARGPRRSSSTSSTGRSAYNIDASSAADVTSRGTPGAGGGRQGVSAGTPPPRVCKKHKDLSKIRFYPTDAPDYDAGVDRCKVMTQKGTQCSTGKNK